MTITQDVGCAEVLELLQYVPGEHVAVCHRLGDDGPFRTSVGTPEGAPGHVAGLPAEADVWFGVNPVRGGRPNGGRGTAEDVTRLAAVVVDLDVKSGGCPDMDTAHTIAADIAAAIGEYPTVIVESGHGLHVYWAIEDGAITAAFPTAEAAALSRRFGRLSTALAHTRNVNVDSVFDLPRVLRMPGTTNHKGEPVPVTARRGNGGPIAVAHLRERLDELGIREERGDAELSAEPLSTPEGWTYAEVPHAYAAAMIDAWRTDAPGGSGRHPSMVSKCVRLAAAHRAGCVSADLHRTGLKVIAQTMERWCQKIGPTRTVGQFEVAAAYVYAVERVARMTDARTMEELGSHTHEADQQLIGGDQADQQPVGEHAPAAPGGAPKHSGQVRIAYRLAASQKDRLRYVNGLGWHYYDGTRWTLDDSGHARRAVIGELRRALGDSVEDPTLRKDVQKCESASGIAGVLEVASALTEFATTAREMDADAYLLNVANGTLDLHTLQLRPHSPADLLTKVCRGAYRPGARSELFEAFLCRILPDADVCGYVQRYVGLGLLGEVREHVLTIGTGTGANGKSVLDGAIRHAFGDYAITAEPDLFMHREGAHPTGEMDLRGVRWVAVSESEKGRRLAEATLKRLTGGDTVRARRMRQDFVEFSPSHTPFLITNHLPLVSGDDEAIWRRLRVVPFDVVIPEADRKSDLGARLQLEADAVLSWAIGGLQEYQMRGLDEPASVLVATSEYRLASDALGRFIAEMCVVTSPVLKATTGKLFDAWERWAEQDGAEPMHVKAFGQALDKRGYPVSGRTSSARWRGGIALRPRGDDDGWDDE